MIAQPIYCNIHTVSTLSVMYSIILLTSQFVLIGVILVQGDLLASSIPLLVLELMGIGLGLWAMLVMGIGHFNIRPEPVDGAPMVQHGPYRILRHPMYTSVLCTTLALVADHPTAVGWSAWCFLVCVLIAKLLFEEKLLARSYPNYAMYRARTWRLIPYLW